MSNIWIVATKHSEVGALLGAVTDPSSTHVLAIGPESLAEEGACGTAGVKWMGLGAASAEAFARAAADVLLAQEELVAFGHATPALRAALGLVSARLGAFTVSDVVKVDVVGETVRVDRTAVDGKVIESLAMPSPACLLASTVTFQPVDPDGSAARSAIERVAAEPLTAAKIADASPIPPSGLETADYVVDVGRGANTPEKFSVARRLAGAIAAYVAARRGKSVLVAERGESAGAKNMTGGRLYAHSLRAVLDAYEDGGADSVWGDIPFERKITHERICLLGEEAATTVDFTSPALAEIGKDSYSVLRGTFDQWLAELAEGAGAEYICGIPVEELVKDGSGSVVGILAGDTAMLCMNLGYQVRGMDFAIASGRFAAEAACDAIDAGDVSATGMVSYMAKLEDSFVMKDFETFKTWPRTMEGWESMFANYPGMAAEVFEAMFAVNGVPQRHLKDRIAPHREEARHIQAAQGDERGAEGPMMKELRPITVNVDELLAVNKYEVDEESAHIELASDNYSELPAEEWGKLVRVCPAALYREDAEGNRGFDYAGCLECGTCRIACEGTVVRKWVNPAPMMGVQYRCG